MNSVGGSEYANSNIGISEFAYPVEIMNPMSIVHIYRVGITDVEIDIPA
jgi:hypothetical protein